jgi:hypothetical protein
LASSRIPFPVRIPHRRVAIRGGVIISVALCAGVDACRGSTVTTHFGLRSTTCGAHAIFPILAALAIVGAAGCGGNEKIPVGTLAGTVTFKNEPVTDAMLYVYNKETASAGQAEVLDGKFNVSGDLRTGTYKVYITRIPPEPGSPFSPVDPGNSGYPPIPEKYQLEEKSDLTVEVKEGPNEVPIVVPEES